MCRLSFIYANSCALGSSLFGMSIQTSPSMRIYSSTDDRTILPNSLRPTNFKWRDKTWSILFQVMACSLMAPSYYLSPCWLITDKEAMWHSHEGNFTENTLKISILDWSSKITNLWLQPYPPGANGSTRHLWIFLDGLNILARRLIFFCAT